MNDTEKHLLFTVLAMFSENKAISISSLSRESGLSRQVIYYYINKTKNKSFKELIEL